MAIPLGDINGDGLADFIAAVRDEIVQDELGESSARSVARIVFGDRGASRPDVTLGPNAPALLLPAPILQQAILPGPGNGAQAFFSTPGDFNDDGIDDIVVLITHVDGASWVNDGVYLLFGRDNWNGQIDILEDADVVITGLSGTASVANAGDINNDNIDDLLIGNPGDGTATVFFGRENWTLKDVFRADFSNENGAASRDGFTIDNTQPRDPNVLDQVDGLWHLTEHRGNNTGHSPNHSMYFGDETLEPPSFNVGRTAGRITSRDIDLTGVSGAELSFNYFLDTEPSTFFDRATVLISTDGGTTFTPILERPELVDTKGDTTEDGWTTATFNLKDFVGQTIQIRFEFDTIDSAANSFEGWYVDDVVVREFLTVANPGNRGVRLNGPAEFGSSVTGIGNFNGDKDGREDFAVLQQDANNNVRLYLVFGRGAANRFENGNIEDIANVVLTFPTDANQLEVRPAGDVNGDSVDDLLITSNNFSILIFGGSIDVSAGKEVDLNTLASQEPGRVLEVEGVGRLFGLGDIDNDGFDDLGAPVLESSPTLAEQEQAGDGVRRHQVGHIFFGRGKFTAADLETPDLVLEPVRPEYILAQFGGGFRPHLFAGVGDTNGGGLADFALADALGGSVHVFFGRRLGDAAPPEDSAPARELFAFDLATPQLPDERSTPGVTLPEKTNETVPVRDAFGLTGSKKDEFLSNVMSLGDINGDGFDDFLFSSLPDLPNGIPNTPNYILLGPVTLEGIESASTRAEILVDPSLLFPAQRMGDINGDGKGDLVFFNPNTNSINIIFGDVEWPRTLDTTAIDATIPGVTGLLEVHVLDWNGDGKDDVLAITSSQDAILFSGDTLTPLIRFRREAGNLNAHGLAVGDVNGDGLEDILLTDTHAAPPSFAPSRRICSSAVQTSLVMRYPWTATRMRPLR